MCSKHSSETYVVYVVLYNHKINVQKLLLNLKRTHTHSHRLFTLRTAFLQCRKKSN